MYCTHKSISMLNNMFEILPLHNTKPIHISYTLKHNSEMKILFDDDGIRTLHQLIRTEHFNLPNTTGAREFCVPSKLYRSANLCAFAILFVYILHRSSTTRFYIVEHFIYT